MIYYSISKRKTYHGRIQKYHLNILEIIVTLEQYPGEHDFQQVD